MNDRAPRRFDVVIPTVARPSLAALLDDLAASIHACGVGPGRIVVVDDRPDSDDDASPIGVPAALEAMTVVVRSGARGPAAARNAGLRRVEAPWVAFLDDDVRLPGRWVRDLDHDIGVCGAGDVATEGRLVVPLPRDRRPTDWERSVGGLATARYITADLAVRSDVLRSCSGFDERFRAAYREDTDLAIRLLRGGHRINQGCRTVTHPVRPAPWWISISKQVGNADDALLAALHGGGWRHEVGAPRGDRPKHLAVSAAAAGAVVLRTLGKSRPSALLAAGSAAGIGALAWRRIAPGPRSMREIAAMTATSVVLPFAATWHWMSGCVRWRHAVAGPSPSPPARVTEPARETEPAR